MRLENRVLVSGMTILIGVMLLLVAGCGDDETNTPTTITGSMADHEFLAVKTQMDDFVDSTIAFFENGINTFQGISDGEDIIPPQYAVNPEQQDSWDTSYTNGWHVIQIAYTEKDQFEDGVWQMSLADSIQYKKNGVAQESWVDHDQLVYKHHWTWDVFDTTVNHTNFEGNADFTFADLTTGLATVTGSRDFNASNKIVHLDSTVWRDFTFTADVNNVTLKNSAFTGWSNCPVGGSVSTTIEMVYTKDDGDPVTTTWNATFTFNNGTMTASVSKGNTVWGYHSDMCDVPQ
ncbi:MAG: hypothetical protein OEV49_00925 [candidate division Zixibacteria bacterium]|nr:hypothetical protein [candidate division Zixibacteria bacterium]MDH3938592.1 hypothetical protein [candidate division Zixibacteria bacterium]MDH4032655.1 hypothetical protein [candidate division Zixibacteria bacterium]